MSNDELNYSVSLSFESVKIPPFNDILLLGKRCPHGKYGVLESLNLLSPDNFEIIEVDNDNVQAMLVHKSILKRIPTDEILSILGKRVFPYITKGECVKVDFNVRLWYDGIEGKIMENEG